MKITKKVIEAALGGRLGFIYGYDYRTRKTIIVNEYFWTRALSALDAAGIPYHIVRVAKSPCTGEISFLPKEGA
jgi:hypothetical protein